MALQKQQIEMAMSFHYLYCMPPCNKLKYKRHKQYQWKIYLIYRYVSFKVQLVEATIAIFVVFLKMHLLSTFYLC